MVFALKDAMEVKIRGCEERFKGRRDGRADGCWGGAMGMSAGEWQVKSGPLSSRDNRS